MPILARASERRALKFNPLHPRDPALIDYFGGAATSSAGEIVNANTAMQEETVLACVRYIAETMASLPWEVNERLDRGRRQATEHWLWDRLHDQFNFYQTSFDAWNLLLNWILLRGNFHVLIQDSQRMAPFELMPLHPDRVRHVEENGRRFYDYTSPTGGIKRLEYGQVWHLPFMPDDGWSGRSVISFQRETIGRAMAMAKYGAQTYANGTQLGGVLKVKRKLSPQAKKTLREDFEQMHASSKNAGRVAIFEEDMDWTPVTMSMVDAQFLETMKYNPISIARIFNVPPHKIKALEEAKWANIEEQQIDATTDTIRPWAVRIEKGAKKDLLTPAERTRGIYIHANLDGLLRGDFKTRQEGLQIMRQNGIISGNDWAEYEDRNPFEGGDVRIVPLNMIPLDQVSQPEPAVRSVREIRSSVLAKRRRAAWLPMIEAAAHRVLRREADNVDRAFKKHTQERSLAEFLAWLDSFYGELRTVYIEGMGQVIDSYVEATGADAALEVDADPPSLDAFSTSYVRAIAARNISESRNEVIRIVTEMAPEEMTAAMADLVHDWRTARPRRLAAREVVQAANAVALHVWREAGVRQVRWVRATDCDECDPLNGMIAGIREEFAPNIAHGPIHEGCACSLSPA